jgi:hypothetical protein
MKMDDKFLSVIETMIANPGDIVDITRSGGEYYFGFRGYVWSVLRGQDSYSVYFYPKWQGKVAELPPTLDYGGDVDMISYHDTDFFDPSGNNLFSNLYRTVQQKQMGVDEAFDQILRG